MRPPRLCLRRGSLAGSAVKLPAFIFFSPGALVAEDSLRSYDQVNDRMHAEILEIRSVPLAPGSGGLQVVIKPENLLEGFRPRRILRLLAPAWPLSELPWEETLWPGDNRVK